MTAGILVNRLIWPTCMLEPRAERLHTPSGAGAHSSTVAQVSTQNRMPPPPPPPPPDKSDRRSS